MLEALPSTQEALPLASSNTAENEEEVGSKTAKEHKGKSWIENDRKVLQKKLAFSVGNSMLKEVDDYLLTGPLDKKPQ